MPSPRVGRWLAPLAALMLLAAAWWGWQRFPALGPGALPGAVPEAAGPATRVARSPRDLYYGPANSLAVLPFVSAGGQEAQAPLARGFAADLLSRLQEVQTLQVTARTSAFFFGDGSTSRRIVAERLQSGYLVSGEWRAEQARLVVAVSLFDARRGQETWSERFEGSLDGIAALRDEVADAVLNALPGQRAPGWAPSPPVRGDAWVELQRGRDLSDPIGAPDLEAAKAHLLRALHLQPDLDSARLALAEASLHPALRQAEPEAAVARAREAVSVVLQRDAVAADRAWALGLLSHLRHQYDWRWQEAAAAAEEAVNLRPGDAGLLALASLADFTLGDFDSARERLEASIQRDPLNLASRLRLGLVQEFSGRYDEALASYRQVLGLRDGYPAAHAFRARVKVLQGKSESAGREAEQEADPFWKRYAGILALLAADRRAEADVELEQMIAEDGKHAAFQVAELFAFAGDTDRAFEWLERARAQRDAGLSALIGNPLLENLRPDPRWDDLLRVLGLPAAAED